MAQPVRIENPWIKLECQARGVAPARIATHLQPSFAQFQEELTPRRAGAVFTDGTPAAETARAALRELLMGQ